MRSVVVRHESPDLGRYERVERAAHPALAGVVNRYCGYAHEGTGHASRREVAQDQVTIILGFGPTLRVAGPGHPESIEHSFVAGLHPSYAVTTEHGSLRGVQIDLTPLGAHMLFGLAMHELSAHLVVALDAVLGGAADELVARLMDAPEWDARFALLDAYIARRIEAARLPSPDVAWACRRLHETGGRLEVGALTAELGCSNRHLVARFREQVGTPPKTLASLIRFRRAVDRLGHDDGSRFAEIAAGCGYYDQAHLNREFRRLAGTTPGAFVASRLPDGLGLRAERSDSSKTPGDRARTVVA
jgi:AraC-like DNA-binding protein